MAIQSPMFRRADATERMPIKVKIAAIPNWDRTRAISPGAKALPRFPTPVENAIALPRTSLVESALICDFWIGLMNPSPMPNKADPNIKEKTLGASPITKNPIPDKKNAIMADAAECNFFDALPVCVDPKKERIDLPPMTSPTAKVDIPRFCFPIKEI